MRCKQFTYICSVNNDKDFKIMTMIFSKLNPDVRFNAINTYCSFMNCKGLEAQVDEFLLNNKSILFNEEGYLMLHEVK